MRMERRMLVRKPAATLSWIDVDVGGDLHRVVFSGLGTDFGQSIRERMEWLSGPGDGLRQLLIEPPFGEPSICVDLVTTPVQPGAQAGFVIMEVMGYPFFSGSNSMATACALLEGGYIPIDTQNGTQCVRLETPGGRVDAHVKLQEGRVEQVGIEGDEAFVHQAEARVYLPDVGAVSYELVWSGGHYIMVDAERLGLSPADVSKPAALTLAATIVEAVQADFDLLHPHLGDVGKPRFLHWMWPERMHRPGQWSGVGGSYGHPGVLWKCPTGTGTAARLARLAHQGRAQIGACFQNTSPSGAMFEASVLAVSSVGDYPSVHTRVVGAPSVAGAVTLTLPSSSPALVGRDLDWLFAENQATFIAPTLD